MCGYVKYKWSVIWRLVNPRHRNLSMFVRSRQSRSLPSAPAIISLEIIRVMRVVPFGRIASAYTWNFCRAAGDYDFIRSQNTQLLLRSSHVCDFVDESGTKRGHIDYWYATYLTMDLWHVDTRSRSVAILMVHERTWNNFAWNVEYRVQHRRPMIFSFPAPRQEL